MKIKCSCVHEFQDKEHKGLRITTPVDKSKINGILTRVRCTVCGKEHQIKEVKLK